MDKGKVEKWEEIGERIDDDFPPNKGNWQSKTGYIYVALQAEDIEKIKELLQAGKVKEAEVQGEAEEGCSCQEEVRGVNLNFPTFQTFHSS